MCYNLPLMKNISLQISGFTKLKPGTHMESGLIYCVYRNQGQGPNFFGVKSRDRFYNLA